MSNILKHERFYMKTVTFLIEDCLFKVPRDPFETESTVFGDMFLLPVGDLHEVEGLDDSKPIRLDGTKKDDFEQLMSVLLHRTYGQSQELAVDVEQWTSVLKLSTLWGFAMPRQTAIDNLSRLAIPPVEKIVLARTYGVEAWLLPAMNALVQRSKPIDMEEASRLGIETALKLASVREQIAVDSAPCRCDRRQHTDRPLLPGPRPDVQTLNFTPILRTTFNIKSVKRIYDPLA
ncbi:hypothetical protein BS17DRAFT_213769 [Gyrodon lividus]|nr:hypothetical protein BS17DRAFT_213769 [Gyrodon lividus]